MPKMPIRIARNQTTGTTFCRERGCVWSTECGQIMASSWQEAQVEASGKATEQAPKRRSRILNIFQSLHGYTASLESSRFLICLSPWWTPKMVIGNRPVPLLGIYDYRWVWVISWKKKWIYKACARDTYLKAQTSQRTRLMDAYVGRPKRLNRRVWWTRLLECPNVSTDASAGRVGWKAQTSQRMRLLDVSNYRQTCLNWPMGASSYRWTDASTLSWTRDGSRVGRTRSGGVGSVHRTRLKVSNASYCRRMRQSSCERVRPSSDASEWRWTRPVDASVGRETHLTRVCRSDTSVGVWRYLRLFTQYARDFPYLMGLIAAKF